MEDVRLEFATEILKACEGSGMLKLQELACEIVKNQSIETVIGQSKYILSILYPTYEKMLLIGEGSAEISVYKYPFDLHEQELSSLLIHFTCYGICSFDKSQLLRSGAEKLMNIFNNPLPIPTTPFCDEDPYLF